MVFWEILFMVPSCYVITVNKTLNCCYHGMHKINMNKYGYLYIDTRVYCNCNNNQYDSNIIDTINCSIYSCDARSSVM